MFSVFVLLLLTCNYVAAERLRVSEVQPKGDKELQARETESRRNELEATHQSCTRKKKKATAINFSPDPSQKDTTTPSHLLEQLWWTFWKIIFISVENLICKWSGVGRKVGPRAHYCLLIKINYYIGRREMIDGDEKQWNYHENNLEYWYLFIRTNNKNSLC